LEIRDAVLSKKYRWTGVRQEMIPKTGKPGKFRPLGIPAINDRLVQEVIKFIIEPIFEIGFSKFSHGFRPNRGCHTALKQINTNMKDSIWFIEGDIKSYFDTIDHTILIGIIQKRIRDPLIINLIKSGLKTRIFTQNKQNHTPEMGTPQGGILSPLLSNIYLHELDLFLEQLSIEYQGTITSKNRKKNPEARKLLYSGQKSLYYKLRIPSRLPNQENYRNCKFVRYADDFIIGVLGSRKLAVEIKYRIERYLNDNLKITLSKEKTKITHISKGIPFLGYIFSKRLLFIRQHYSGRLLLRKINICTLDVDLKRIIARLKEAGFCDGSGIPLPAFRFLRLPQSEINIKINYILNGLSSW
jgi:group II intron reverse transcriptase/maturase